VLSGLMWCWSVLLFVIFCFFCCFCFFFFFSSRRRHTRLQGDWSSDVCSSDLLFIFAGEEVDEFGSAGFDGAAGFFIFWNDQVAQSDERGVLRGRKIFRSVVPCRRSGLFLVNHLMGVCGGFGGNDLQDRASSADGKSAQDVATRDGLVCHVKCCPFWLRRGGIPKRARRAP